MYPDLKPFLIDMKSIQIDVKEIFNIYCIRHEEDLFNKQFPKLAKYYFNTYIDKVKEEQLILEDTGFNKNEINEIFYYLDFIKNEIIIKHNINPRDIRITLVPSELKIFKCPICYLQYY